MEVVLPSVWKIVIPSKSFDHYKDEDDKWPSDCSSALQDSVQTHQTRRELYCNVFDVPGMSLSFTKSYCAGPKNPKLTCRESARCNIPLDLLEQRIHAKSHVWLTPPRALCPASMQRRRSLASMQRVRLVSVQRLA